MRLELSQNKSKVFKKFGSIWKFSSQIYALFCRIMSQQAFSHYLKKISTDLLCKFIKGGAASGVGGQRPFINFIKTDKMEEEVFS